MECNKLKEILELHKKWRDGDVNGIRADLQGADLQSVDLRGADLYGVDLRGADLQGAYLQGANLQSADLRGADLYGADLRSADLSHTRLERVGFQDTSLQYVNFYGADLYGADLRGADLYGADLRSAHFQGANLYGADLQGANLQSADFQGADLQNADLRDAYLYGADLQGAKNIPDLSWTSIVPECGSFIGWKNVGNYIIKLRILDDAKRSNATGRKCRCSAAEVLEIQNIDGTESGIDRVYNDNYCGANYVVGEIVTPDSFDDNRWNECSNGIHFFITRQEAVDYA